MYSLFRRGGYEVGEYRFNAARSETRISIAPIRSGNTGLKGSAERNWSLRANSTNRIFNYASTARIEQRISSFLNRNGRRKAGPSTKFGSDIASSLASEKQPNNRRFPASV